MKKAILVIAAMGATYMGMAQEKFVTSALTALSVKSYDEAKQDIDKAMASPETKDKPKTLFAKGQIYMTLQGIDKYTPSHPYREATSAFMKVAELKPEAEKEAVNANLFYGAQLYYNDAINAYNDKKYAEATELLKYAVKIHEVGGGKRWADKFPAPAKLVFDTMVARSYLFMANSAYSVKDSVEAIRLFTIVKGNPITKSLDNYFMLLECYEKYNKANGNKMSADELATIQEARTAYPNDVNIRTMEMNCYVRNNKLNDLMKKMEDVAAKEPDNADVIFNLGLLYQNLAHPASGAKPANAAEYYSKAEASLTRALKLAPQNATYNYNLGITYYLQGYDFNEEMNNVTGNSAADMKKYNGLKLKRDDFFNKALTYVDKAYKIFQPNETTLNDSDKDTYRSVLNALKGIYALQNNTAKTEEMVDKINKLK